MGWERRGERLLTRAEFWRRYSRYLAVAAALIGVSLAIGMLGYRWFEGQSWADSFLNAAMLMGGMGPVGDINTTGGKIFAGCYALYCGLAFLFTVGLLATPIAHRLLHHFHADPEDGGDAGKGDAKPAGEKKPKRRQSGP